MKAYEITLSTAEVIYVATTTELLEVLAEVNGGKQAKLTIKKDSLMIADLKIGKKFSAKFSDGDKAEVRVVEHDFAPVIASTPRQGGSWVRNAVEFIKTHGYQEGSALAIEKDPEYNRHWVLVDGYRVFWTRKVERANLLIERLVA